MKVCKLSVCKEPILYQSVHENLSESLLHSFFLHKKYNFHLLIYSQPPVVRHFTNWWHLSHFPWITAFTCTFATSILWCYSFNGMIKWYHISCGTLYNYYRAFKVKDRNDPSVNTCLHEWQPLKTAVCSTWRILVQHIELNFSKKPSIWEQEVPTKVHGLIPHKTRY